MDKELVFCMPGSYFSGSCCQPVNLSAIDMVFSYSSTKTLIRALITNTSRIPDVLLNSFSSDFSVVSVGYSGAADVTERISTLFTAK
jgi:hypothetical protein